MFIRALTVLLALSLASIGFAQQVTLDVGDEAPQIGDSLTWLQGDPVTEFKDGHVYVLDFWAPWCTPCIQMMPHMAELAEKYAPENVHILGISVFPRPGMTPTKEWVEKNGSQFPYAFAEDPTEAIEKAYLSAANIYRLPTVMIVDRDGLIAYVGSPYGDFDRRLDRIVKGEFSARLAKKSNEMLSRAEEMARDGDWQGSLDLVDEVIELDPSNNGQYAVSKYQILLLNPEVQALELSEDAPAYGRRAVRELIQDNIEALDYLAWFVTMNQNLPVEERDLELARIAAERADEVANGENVSVLETIAAIYEAEGELDKAIEYLELAITKADDQEMVETLRKSLETYAAKRDK